MKTLYVTNVSDRAVGIPGGETLYPLGVTLAPGEQVEIDLSSKALKSLGDFKHVEISDVGRPTGSGDPETPE